MQGRNVCVLPPSVAQPFSLFSMSDKEILEEIYDTHVHADENFDDDSLFVIVESILTCSTQIVDQIIQSPMCMDVENIEEKTPKANFNVPLCILKGISCEMQCKEPGDEIAHNTTVAILNKLSGYSWEAKAVLTLAAFSMEFGDFWLLTQHTDRLSKSIAFLKRVPVQLKPSDVEKRRSVLQLNNLVKVSLQVIDYLDQLNKLSRNDPKDVPELSTVMSNLPVDVYWAIISIVACTAKVTALTCDECKEFDLTHYSDKISSIRNKLKKHLDVCTEQLDVAQAYKRILKIIQTPTEIIEVLKALIFTKDNGQQLTVCSTEKILQVEIEVLRRKNVLLFFSSLEISDKDISILISIHEDRKKDDQHKIIWIPIVNQWTDDLREKFESRRTDMLWYTVEFSASIASLKFIKEQWNFTGKPIVVALNPQGMVEHHDAFNMIRVWGADAFPFTTAREVELSGIHGKGWIPPVVDNFSPSVRTWINKKRIIIFYGGKVEWIQQFTKSVCTLKSHSFLKETEIQLEFVACQGNGSEGKDDNILGSFWSDIESLYLTKINKQYDAVTQQVHTLLSYKSGESGWFMLSKGSSVVVTGHGISALKVVKDFEQWRERVNKENSFEFCFKSYYEEVSRVCESRPCCRLDMPGSNVKLPVEMMKCSDCQGTMETFTSYRCCHGATAHH